MRVCMKVSKTPLDYILVITSQKILQFYTEHLRQIYRRRTDVTVMDEPEVMFELPAKNPRKKANPISILFLRYIFKGS